MLKRIVTAIVGLPLLIAVINIGGLPLQILLMALALVGLFEFYRSISKKHLPIHFIGYFFTALYYALITRIGVGSNLLILLTVFIMAAQSCLVIFYKKIELIDCIVTVYGFFYVSFLLSFIYLIREHNYGLYFVWLVFTSSFGSDTFAYFTGITLGRHKLKDTPSPSKSVEGTVGGVLGAALVGFLYGLFVTYVLGVNGIHMIINSTVVSLAGAVFSIFGDLSASALKRYTSIKDFGKIFPGHGGVLDRFDSVIATAPIVYIVMLSVMKLGGLQ